MIVCVCVSLVRVVIICLASTHTALVSSPSLDVFTFLPLYVGREVMRSQLARRAVRRFGGFGGWSGACLIASAYL